ncbi:hypothetical protein [Marinisporobacter balticus]|uniref:Uncharacterized protein n=1 Tax=Marinisporobacter balticus TaxID=2018667 RepID=A0A4R2KKE0_9FIRM|nr:hypothetical protein [Marinisporobacter balticus]TCO73794.1 hypothetical protein EV214_11427 [Marinisporobacter balticus]
MTQKTMRGIVGKKLPTTNHREDVGVGISFTEEHVSDSASIEKIVTNKKRKQGLK